MKAKSTECRLLDVRRTLNMHKVSIAFLFLLRLPGPLSHHKIQFTFKRQKKWKIYKIRRHCKCASSRRFNLVWFGWSVFCKVISLIAFVHFLYPSNASSRTEGANDIYWNKITIVLVIEWISPRNSATPRGANAFIVTLHRLKIKNILMCVVQR